MRVKICGLTTLEDALCAAEAGADYLGFIFYPKSPRYVTPEACAAIVAGLPPTVIPVGLFVNEAPERVAEVLAHCGLQLAQLHGDEPPAALAALEGRAYKAFRGPGVAHAAYAAAGPGQPAFLVDAQVAGAYGGTGHTADWAAARALAAQYPLMLAGGLTPENVAAAIAAAQPWGVDVASGVERAPGLKDHAKVRAFVEAAKNTGLD